MRNRCRHRATEDHPGKVADRELIESKAAQKGDLPRRPNIPLQQRAADDQIGDAIGISRSGDSGRLATHVDAYDRSAIHVPVIEQRDEPVGHRERGRPTHPRFAPAHPRPIEGDRLEFGKQGNDSAPHLQVVGIAVKKDDRRTFAAAKIAEAFSIHVVKLNRQHDRRAASRRREPRKSRRS